jgi:hypothetical protein
MELARYTQVKLISILWVVLSEKNEVNAGGSQAIPRTKSAFKLKGTLLISLDFLGSHQCKLYVLYKQSITESLRLR